MSSIENENFPSLTATCLQILATVRERCSRVFSLAQQGKLQYFDYHPEKEKEVALFCVKIIQRDYGSDFKRIAPHGRWQHIDHGVERIKPLMDAWTADLGDSPSTRMELARRVVDLFVVSVLLDAGAGPTWSYTEQRTGQTYSKSEGLAVASVNMFEAGLFSTHPNQKHRVDGDGLVKLTPEILGSGLQVSDENPIVGLEGRTQLLVSLGAALKSNTYYFGGNSRPGNIIDYLRDRAQYSSHSGSKFGIRIEELWYVLLDGLNCIWPARLQYAGVSLGDVWECPALSQEPTVDLTAISSKFGKEEVDNAAFADTLVPFHKLTMWLTYSIVDALDRILGWEVYGIDDMTGLPEYRNGGLLIDFGVLTLKPNALPVREDSGLPYALPSHPAIVEWRAMTVIELDRIATLIRNSLGPSLEMEGQLTLAQILQGATWIGGREIAKIKRPETGGPPIEVESDGTLF